VDDLIYFYANMSTDWGNPNGLWEPPATAALGLDGAGIFRSVAGTMWHRWAHPPHFSGYQSCPSRFKLSGLAPESAPFAF
jgi:hypothetical protein